MHADINKCHRNTCHGFITIVHMFCQGFKAFFNKIMCNRVKHYQTTVNMPTYFKNKQSEDIITSYQC